MVSVDLTVIFQWYQAPKTTKLVKAKLPKSSYSLHLGSGHWESPRALFQYRRLFHRKWLSQRAFEHRNFRTCEQRIQFL